jgi:hypothetical protein
MVQTDIAHQLVKKTNDEPERVAKEEFERRLKELVKCKNDIVYFAETYFYIMSLDGGVQHLKLYPKQRELLQAFIDNNRTVVLASRQTGKCVSGKTKIHVRFRPLGLEFDIPIGWFFKIQKLLSYLCGN